jgi:hypothetical protein
VAGFTPVLFLVDLFANHFIDWCLVVVAQIEFCTVVRVQKWEFEDFMQI